MGNNGGSNLKSEETTLLLFTLFGILVVLFLLLLTIVFQTFALWRMARVVIAENTPSEMEGRRKSSGFGWFGAGSSAQPDEEAGEKKRYE